MKTYDVIIVGSGPSGMMTAYQIQNKSVLILEANETLGGKLKVSGGGRCNVTNKKDIESFLENVPKNNKFLYSTFNNFQPLDVIDFFENNNVKLKEEDNNRMFPKSNVSQTIIDFFTNYFNDSDNIDYYTEYLVKEIDYENNKFIINKQFTCTELVMATGGVTYPNISQGDIGHKLLEKLSHTATDLLPTESPLISNDQLIKDKTFQGITILNTSIDLYINNKKKKTFKDNNILFTHFGLSGPLALKASYYIKDAIQKGKKCRIEIKIKDEDPKKVKEYIKENKIQNHTLKINIEDIKGYNTAFLTNGGIKTKEIDQKTFQSKLIPKLYIVGELIDVHAFTGGYNIATCFSEGYTLGTYINTH